MPASWPSDSAPVHDDLETPRLKLRRFTGADVENLVELDSDQEVMHYITNGKPTSREEIVETILPAMLDGRPGASYGFWAVSEKESGEFIGWFHLIPDGEHHAGVPELGYRLRRSAWGKGYATEGSRALVDLAFAQLGAERVRAETMAVHAASRRVMEKAGMRYIRTFDAGWPIPIPGDEFGDVEYAITRAEWELQREVAQPS